MTHVILIGLARRAKHIVFQLTMYTFNGNRTFVRRGHLSDKLYESLRTFVRHGHLSDNLTSNVYLKQFHMLKGLYQVIIKKHEQGIDANCGN